MVRSRLTGMRVLEEVAIMPVGADSPDDVLAISIVRHVGHAFIMANDGRLYMRVDGAELNYLSGRYIQPATDEHRRAIRRKQLGLSKSPQSR